MGSVTGQLSLGSLSATPLRVVHWGRNTEPEVTPRWYFALATGTAEAQLPMEFGGSTVHTV